MAKSDTKQQTQGRAAVQAFNNLTKSQKIVVGVVAAILVVVFVVLMATVPEFSDAMYELLGIRTSEARIAAQIESPTKVHIIDVGQGDAALLEQNGEFALIDTGPPEGRDNLLSYLSGIGVQRLRYLIMTHPHADHIGNMRAVVERYEVQNMILPDLDKAPYPTTSMFEKLLAALTEKGVPTQVARAGTVYPLGSASITVLQDGLTTKDNYNLLSLALLFEAEGFRFIDTGDAEIPNETALLESGEYLRADVFMAGHHGSSTSNTESFLRAINPQVVVISLGADNSYGHPHREALASYAAVQALVLRTDESGSVVLGPDEEGGVAYAVSK